MSLSVAGSLERRVIQPAKQRSDAMNNLTIGYFADGPWSHRAFEKLQHDPSISIAFVCARFDRPDPVLREQAASHRIDFVTHPRINAAEFLQTTQAYGCDLFVSMSFNQIFGERLMCQPRLGTINCHAGKLPFYRGRNILNWVLINDEREFGITVHYVDAGIDTGDILAQRVFPITDDDDLSTLLETAYGGCTDLLYETVKQLQSGNAIRTRQTSVHPTGFYCSRRVPGDERLDWRQSSRDIFNFVRAICSPGPEARTFCGEVEIRINRVQLIPDAPIYKGVPGAVVGVCADAFVVKTMDSSVKVVEWIGAENIKVGDRLT